MLPPVAVTVDNEIVDFLNDGIVSSTVDTLDDMVIIVLYVEATVDEVRLLHILLDTIVIVMEYSPGIRGYVIEDDKPIVFENLYVIHDNLQFLGLLLDLLGFSVSQ